MSEDKRKIYNRSGLGHRIGYGKRPALLVVDMQIGLPHRKNLRWPATSIRRLRRSTS
jgi:hypothetical protein